VSARRHGKGRGGRGGHEPRRRVRLREAQVFEYVLAGRTQHQIAEALGISQPAVSKIVRRVEDRLLADLTCKAERQRARQTLRLEHLYGQAMQAWQDSKQEGLRRRQRKTEHGSGTSSTVAELISENRHGDPRYLDEARKALTDLRKVWGVDAPERVSIDALTVFASMSDEALDQELTRQLRLVQRVLPILDVPAVPAHSQGDDHDNQA
jgi:DNA-binding CsgD family transcriptional regulator